MRARSHSLRLVHPVTPCFVSMHPGQGPCKHTDRYTEAAHACTHADMHVHTHADTHVHTHAFVYQLLRTPLRIRKHMSTHMSAHMSTQMYKHMSATHVCNTCLRACLHVGFSCACTHVAARIYTQIYTTGTRRLHRCCLYDSSRTVMHARTHARTHKCKKSTHACTNVVKARTIKRPRLRRGRLCSCGIAGPAALCRRCARPHGKWRVWGVCGRVCARARACV